ncbi:dihydrofolate reductase family protein [Chloroflexota bacterium]
MENYTKRTGITKVIMHNSVSLDGAFTDFEVDMELHYRAAGRYKADANLIGSNTISSGIDVYGGEILPEDETDFTRPSRGANLPYWVIVDTKGITRYQLHTCRRFEFCRDVIVLISEKTDDDYVSYLEERSYDYLVCGTEHVDLEKALGILSTKYGVKTVLIDSGPTLNGVMLSMGLIDEISLLVSPVLVGSKSDKSLALLDTGSRNYGLELLTCEEFDGGLLLLRYKICRDL